MPALFRPSANAIYWSAILTITAAIVAVPVVTIAWARTPYATGANQPVEQPVKFDHRHHVRDDGIDCTYCHANAMKGKTAGVPATSVCMGCHAQVWTDSPELQPVQRSWFDGTPLRWERVASLPDFVFFDHSAHTAHGVGCVTCHGRVDLMAAVYAPRALTMSFCLECHRAPDEHLRPHDRITDMDWVRDPARDPSGHELRERLRVENLTDCTHCHR